MKSIIVSFLLLFTVAAHADLGAHGRSAAKDPVTGNSLGGFTEKFYVNAKNLSNGALAAGSVVVPSVVADDGYSATTSATAGAFPLCVYEVACAVNAFCKCQTYGVANVLVDVANGISTAGQQAFLSEGTAGYAQSETLGSVAATDIPIGVFLDSDSNPGTSGSKQVFLRLR